MCKLNFQSNCVLKQHMNKFYLQVEGFYALHPNAGAGKRAREQSIEAIKQAIGWKQRYENQVNDWLENNV